MAGLFRKYSEPKSRISPCSHEAGNSPCQQRDLVFDYVTIKAERSDLTRERARLADFIDGRPFDPIERWHRFNVRGTRKSNRRRQALPASHARCWDSHSVARRQLTIATRKCVVHFDAASVINRGTELRAQDRKKLLHAERFLQHGASRMPGGEARNAVPRREKERTSTRGEYVGDRINPL